MQLRVLAVDDERVTLEMFKSIVGSLGYEVVTLSDSREAAQRVMTEKFDLIAVDVLMPNLDGFELTERIRASRTNHSVPILMLTGSDSVETMRRGYAVGITFYLAKPISAPKLRGLFKAARGMMVEERRRYGRLPLRVDVECQVGNKRFRVRSVDLAQGGILLEGSGGLVEGEIAEVKFALPGVGQPLKLMGKVLRRELSGGMAVEFIDPEPPERAALQHYVTVKTGE
jgi:CheY-like chemotaxis protein